MDKNARLFAFDLGTNSLGWSVLEINADGKAVGIVDCGVRIFSNAVHGRALKPASAERKSVRAASRRRDRFLRRRKALVRALVSYGLLPPDRDAYGILVRRGEDRGAGLGVSPSDPYILRARALTGRLEPHEIGRVVMHLARRRGRHERSGEAGSREPAIMQLAIRRTEGRSVRHRANRLPPPAGEPDPPKLSREDAEIEFSAMWAHQKRYHEQRLCNNRRKHIADIVFGERGSATRAPGMCSLTWSEARVARSDPAFQRFRLLKTLNELRVREERMSWRPLSLEERNQLLDVLEGATFVSFSKVREILNLGVLAELSMRGSGLYGSGSASRNSLKGYARYGASVVADLIREMEAAVIPESDAIRLAGYGRESACRTSRSSLPPYSDALHEFQTAGNSQRTNDLKRVSNDTVHVALNQLRKVCNALIKRHGKPEKIALELARDTTASATERAVSSLLSNERTRIARQRSGRFEAARMAVPGARDTKQTRLKHKLWEELGPAGVRSRREIYSGRIMDAAAIFSGAIQIDHILPYSMTANSHHTNLTVSFADNNRIKGNRAPADVVEWLGRQPRIKNRAGMLPAVKRWRFLPIAIGRIDSDSDFPRRQLPETRLLARLARNYLSCLFGGAGSAQAKKRIRVVPGRVTARLRRYWGLENLPVINGYLGVWARKSRTDHRQHAIDAIVIGVADAAMVRSVVQATAYRNAGTTGTMPSAPWPTFREDVVQAVASVVVSHKPDHGTLNNAELRTGKGKTIGKLHNATAFGPTGLLSGNGVPIVAGRKPFLQLAPADIPKIRDRALRLRIAKATETRSGGSFRHALLEFAKTDQYFGGIRRVRLLHAMRTVELRDESGNIYKCHKGNSNHRADIWQLADGHWVAEIVTMFAAHDRHWKSVVAERHHNPKKIMRLHRHDLVAIGGIDSHPDSPVYRVVKFSVDGRICFAPHFAAGRLKARHRDVKDPFRYRFMSASTLKKNQARQIRVDEIGRVFDPGPSGGP